MSPPFLTVDKLQISFAGTPAVRGISLSVAAGELLSLLGPSGCGKTTLLRAIAGYILPDAGRVTLSSRDITAMPPQARGIGMVFQNYALFPHMTVAQNISFPLRVRGQTNATMRERVDAMLEMVRLSEFGNRRPSQLSGGQQQRVALARALAFEPQLLLLDEPLGALDLHMRESMQIELRRIQRETGVTTILVTHDQGEALAMSDRVAVMNNGRIEQIGTPRDLYENPSTAFVADFVGKSNLLEVRVVALGGGAMAVELPGVQDRLKLAAASAAGLSEGPYLLSIRQEHVALGRDPAGAHFAGQVAGVQYAGTHQVVILRAETGATFLARDDQDWEIGDRAYASFAPEKIRILSREPSNP